MPVPPEFTPVITRGQQTDLDPLIQELRDMAPDAWPGIETVLILAYRLGRYHEQERASS